MNEVNDKLLRRVDNKIKRDYSKLEQLHIAMALKYLYDAIESEMNEETGNKVGLLPTILTKYLNNIDKNKRSEVKKMTDYILGL